VAEPRPGGADLALRLSLASLLLHPVGPFPLRPAILLCAAAGLTLPWLLRSRWLWCALALLVAARPVLDWPLSDNHAYLLAYWCFALFLTLGARDGDAALRDGARLLIGLAFLFAAVWKGLLSPDFLSGDFMRFAWITDPRLGEAARLLGGLDEAMREANLAFLAGAPDAPPSLLGGGRLDWAARLVSGWTLALECIVAVGFLAPGSRSLRRIGHFALLLFAATTYTFVTIESFAWLLLSMGVALADSRSLRAAYLAVYALVLFFAYTP
jgi:hypothetical protein